MSKITMALQRASAERGKTNPTAHPKHNTDEVRQAAEKTLNDIQSWSASFDTVTSDTAASATTHHDNGSTGGNGAASAKDAETPATPQPVAPVQNTGVSPEAWESAVRQCETQLLEHERQATRHQWEQGSLQVQVAVYEQLSSQVQQQLAALKKHLDSATAAAAASEATRAERLQQLVELHELQACAQTTRLAERELQATSEIVDQLTQSQQRAVEELLRYRKRRDELNETVRRLRAQLGWPTAGHANGAGPVVADGNRPQEPRRHGADAQ